MRPEQYGLSEMEVGSILQKDAPTPADVKRLARNVSIYGIRNNKGFRCRTDRQTRVMTITRVR